MSDLEKRIAEIEWFHSMEIGGVVAKGWKSLDALRWEADRVFDFDVSGKTVLDIGAWDGFFSFEAHRRGARRVLATDHFSWSGDGFGTKAGFDLVNEHLGHPVESLDIDPMEIDPEKVGRFDVVLFLGVFYHLRHPLLGLERAAGCADERLVLETHLDERCGDVPAMVFYPGIELNNDPTNWWGPNRLAMIELLKSTGFDSVSALTKNDSRRRRKRRPFTRGIFHATRSGARRG